MKKHHEHANKTREEFLEDIIKTLVERRKELGITQEALDFIVGLSDRQISKWECGERIPKSFNLYCWADALNGRLAFIPNEYDFIKTDGVLHLVRKMEPANDNKR